MITDRFLFVEDFLPVCPFVDVTHPGGYCVVHSKISNKPLQHSLELISDWTFAAAAAAATTAGLRVWICL